MTTTTYLLCAKVAGGGLLQKGTMTTDADAKEKMNGSCIIVRAESEAQVWETLRLDPFYTSGEVVSYYPCIQSQPSSKLKNVLLA